MTGNGIMNSPNLWVFFPSCECLADHPATPLQIEARTIHVWGAGFDQTASRLDRFHRWLNAEEQARAARFVHEQDRRRYVLAHGSLRAILSRYLDCSADAVRFGRQPGGKPCLVLEDTQEPFTFSMAHSHNRLVIAVAKGEPIGIDLEHMRASTDVLKLAERFYRPSELAQMAGLPSAAQLSQFFRYWVAKEAALKGEGVGLPSLHDCEVLAAGSGDRATIHLRMNSAMHPHWNVRWLSCGLGWEGAVAFQSDMAVHVMSEG